MGGVRVGRVVRTHVNPHGGLKLLSRMPPAYPPSVRTHVNPHGGLKLAGMQEYDDQIFRFGPTLILTED